MGYSQQIIENNEHILNKYALSPAFAGYTGQYEMFCTYKRNLAGFSLSPEKINLNINGPLQNNSGIGITINSEKYGIFNNTLGGISYAHRVSLGNDHKLHFGLMAFFENFNINLNKVSNHDNGQTYSQKYFDSWFFNGQAALAYSFKNIYAGISVFSFWNNNSKFNESLSLDNPPLIRFHVSGTYDIASNFTIDGTSMLFMQNRTPSGYSIYVRTIFKKRFWITTGFSLGNTFGLGFGSVFNNKYSLSYNYEYKGNALQANTFGNHELTLGVMIFAPVGQNNNIQKQQSIFNTDDSK